MRRPLLVLLGGALLASGLAQLKSAAQLQSTAQLRSMVLWLLPALGLYLVWHFRGRRMRAPRLHGLGSSALVTWLVVCLLHVHGSRRPEVLFEGTWRVDARDADDERGHFEEGGGSFELPVGLVREGERLRFGPSRAPRVAAGAPDFVRRRETRGWARRVEVDEIERLAERGSSPTERISQATRSLREAGLARVARIDAPATRGLTAALLFGDKSQLPRGMGDLFTRTGTRHALAVSGLHVGLVAAMWIWPLGSALAWLLRRATGGRGSTRVASAREVLSAPELWRAALLILFVPLSGSGAPVMRAALALTLAQLASVFRARPNDAGELCGARRADALSLWSLALLLEWLADPACLGSISVLLSYGATLGLLLYARPTLRWLRSRIPGGGKVAPVGRLGRRRPRVLVLLAQRTIDLGLAGLAASFAANLATLPMVWFIFGEWSWVGSIATLLLLPLLAAFLGVAWAWVVLPIEPLEFVLDYLAQAQVGLLEAFDVLPGTPINLPSRPMWVLALVAALSFAAAWRPRAARLALATWSVLVLPWRGPVAALEVHALDVGHGTALVVRAPGEPCWIFDAGSRDRPGVAREALAPLLRELDVGRVAIALSHGEADHAGALPWLVERYPPVAWAGALPAHIAERLPHGTPRFDLPRGRLAMELGVGSDGLQATLLRGLEGSGNEGSRDLELSWRGRRLLLCGDAEQRGRGRSLAAGLVRGPCDLLLFPHHGSDTPWLGPLLEACEPAQVWFSAEARPAVADELDRRGLVWRSTHSEGALSWRLVAACDATLAHPGTDHAITDLPTRRP